jgi:CRP-like cAMP-binding protein
MAPICICGGRCYLQTMGKLPEKNFELISAIKKHWDELIDRGQLLSYQPDQYLFYENHQALGAYLLCKGTIGLLKADDPSFQKIISAQSQPIIGMDYLISGDTYDYSAKAVTLAELCYLPKSEILRLLPKKDASAAG